MPVPALVIVIVTPGSTPPDASLIVPDICPVFCAAADAAISNSDATQGAIERNHFIVSPLPSRNSSANLLLDFIAFVLHDDHGGHRIEHRTLQVERRRAV